MLHGFNTEQINSSGSDQEMFMRENTWDWLGRISKITIDQGMYIGLEGGKIGRNEIQAKKNM